MAEICKDLLKVENVNDEIENLETLLELTKNYCLSKEFQSVHYNLWTCLFLLAVLSVFTL